MAFENNPNEADSGQQPVASTVDPANAIANVNYGDIQGADAGAPVDRSTHGSSNARMIPGKLANFDNPPANAVVRAAPNVPTHA